MKKNKEKNMLNICDKIKNICNKNHKLEDEEKLEEAKKRISALLESLQNLSAKEIEKELMEEFQEGIDRGKNVLYLIAASLGNLAIDKKYGNFEIVQLIHKCIKIILEKCDHKIISKNFAKTAKAGKHEGKTSHYWFSASIYNGANTDKPPTYIKRLCDIYKEVLDICDPEKISENLGKKAKNEHFKDRTVSFLLDEAIKFASSKEKTTSVKHIENLKEHIKAIKSLSHNLRTILKEYEQLEQKAIKTIKKTSRIDEEPFYRLLKEARLLIEKTSNSILLKNRNPSEITTYALDQISWINKKILFWSILTGQDGEKAIENLFKLTKNAFSNRFNDSNRAFVNLYKDFEFHKSFLTIENGFMTGCLKPDEWPTFTRDSLITLANISLQQKDCNLVIRCCTQYIAEVEKIIDFGSDNNEEDGEQNKPSVLEKELSSVCQLRGRALFELGYGNLALKDFQMASKLCPDSEDLKFTVKQLEKPLFFDKMPGEADDWKLFEGWTLLEALTCIANKYKQIEKQALEIAKIASSNRQENTDSLISKFLDNMSEVLRITSNLSSLACKENVSRKSEIEDKQYYIEKNLLFWSRLLQCKRKDAVSKFSASVEKMFSDKKNLVKRELSRNSEIAKLYNDFDFKIQSFLRSSGLFMLPCLNRDDRCFFSRNSLVMLINFALEQKNYTLAIKGCETYISEIEENIDNEKKDEFGRDTLSAVKNQLHEVYKSYSSAILAIEEKKKNQAKEEEAEGENDEDKISNDNKNEQLALESFYKAFRLQPITTQLCFNIAKLEKKLNGNEGVLKFISLLQNKIDSIEQPNINNENKKNTKQAEILKNTILEIKEIFTYGDHIYINDLDHLQPAPNILQYCSFADTVLHHYNQKKPNPNEIREFIKKTDINTFFESMQLLCQHHIDILSTMHEDLQKKGKENKNTSKSRFFSGLKEQGEMLEKLIEQHNQFFSL